jgi:proliferating cell nuclear antigen
MKLIIQDKNKISKFATIFQYAKNFTETIILDFTQERLYIQSMDKAHVCLLELHLQNDWFDLYEYEDEKENLFVGVNNELFYKIINSKQEEQQMKIEYEDGSDTINLSFSEKEDLEELKNAKNAKNAKKKNTKKKKANNKSKKKGKEKEVEKKDKSKHFSKSFEMKTFDVENQLLGIPEYDYSVDLILPAKVCVSLSQELSMFNDNVRIICSQDNVELIASGNTGKMKVNMDIDDVIEYAIEEGVQLDITYSIQYFQLMCQFHKLADKVTLGFSENLPMTMMYELDETSSMKFYLAPVMDDDNEEDNNEEED